MGLIKEPFDQMVATLGATHHWPLTGTDPANTELLGGADLSVSIARLDAYEGGTLLADGSTLYTTIAGNNWGLTVNGLPTHFTNAGLSEYTLVFFYRMLSDDIPSGVMHFEGAGEGSANGGFNLKAFKVHSDGTYQRHTNDRSGNRSTDTVDPNTQGVGNGLIFTWTPVAVVGHILYFPTALSAEDLTTIYRQRLFLGSVSGTATVDGVGEPVTVRTVRRASDEIASETVAAADGSYKAWVSGRSSDVDVYAIPPDGIAARPIAHGPITPINEN